MSDHDWALTEEELHRLDQAYPSFPSFEEWVAKTSVDDRQWDEFRRLLAEHRESVSAEDVVRAREVVVRAAAWDTGALEGLYQTDRGFTFTVAQQAPHWERDLAERGPLAPALFEAQLRTYDLVLDAVTQKLPVTEAWVRRLHEEVCSPQEKYLVHTPVGPQEHTLPRGEYKHHPNHVLQPTGTPHAYAPVDRVQEEMHRLVTVLQSEEFAAAHPVHQASYAHYAFVVIHPFADGNGRVARALASTYFYRDLSLPLVVLHEQRNEYLDALAAADAGDLQGFVSFVFERGVETMLLVDDQLLDPLVDAESALGDLRNVLMTPSGHTHQMLDQLAVALLTTVQAEFQTQLEQLSLPVGVTFDVDLGYGGVLPSPPSGYRDVPTAAYPHVQAMLSSASPATASHVVRLVPWVATGPDQPFTLMVSDLSGGAPLRVRASEVSPAITPGLQLRVRQWVGRTIGQMLEVVAKEARESLRSAGLIP